MDDLAEKIRNIEKILGLDKSNDPYAKLAKELGVRRQMDNPDVPKSRAVHAIYPGIVTSTKDPYSRGRVKVYVGMIHSTRQMSEDDLPWATVLSWGGGLDDQGATFTPPAGSQVMIGFAYGDKDNPIVMGTMPHQSRGTYHPISEEQERWGAFGVGRRGVGHLKGAVDHLLPPWNNESYNSDDLDQKRVNADGTSVTMPHIYGYKSPEGAFLRFDDGVHEQNLRNKSVLLQSSKGSVFFMKDDATTSADDFYAGAYRDEDEERYPGSVANNRMPYNGHRIELPQTGLQIQSFGGHRMIFDDSLSTPDSDNQWTAKFGGDVKPFASRIMLQTISEHQIVMRDRETTKGVRSALDGIFLQTATGNNIEMSDHTVGGKAGARRGIRMRTTSDHTFEMLDEGCSAVSPLKRATGSALDALPASIRTPALAFAKASAIRAGANVKAPDNPAQTQTAVLEALDRFLMANGSKEEALAGQMLALASEGATHGQVQKLALDSGVEASAANVSASAVQAVSDGEGPRGALNAISSSTGNENLTGDDETGNFDSKATIQRAVDNDTASTIQGVGSTPGGVSDIPGGVAGSAIPQTGAEISGVRNADKNSVFSGPAVGVPIGTVQSDDEKSVISRITTEADGAPDGDDVGPSLSMMNSASLTGAVRVGAGDGQSSVNPNHIIENSGLTPEIVGNKRESVFDADIGTAPARESDALSGQSNWTGGKGRTSIFNGGL